MITRHGAAWPVSRASRGCGALFAPATGLAGLALVFLIGCGADTAALARNGASDRSAAARSDADAAPESSPQSSCNLSRFAAGRVKTVFDGRSFMLEDGREFRLAAIEVAPVATAAASAGEAARNALAALVADREVVLKYTDAMLPPVDRYERFVVFGFVTDGRSERSLQEALLAGGKAQLSPHVEPAGCRRSLRAQEDNARRAGIGLWADPRHAVHDAGKPADILPQRGRFAVIEGKVVSVRESGGTIYINFSRRWSQGFSAFIRKRNAARFAAAGLDLKRLQGRRLELRGYVEQRRGLLMAVERPEQIAIIAGTLPAGR